MLQVYGVIPDFAEPWEGAVVFGWSEYAILVTPNYACKLQHVEKFSADGWELK